MGGCGEHSRAVLVRPRGEETDECPGSLPASWRERLRIEHALDRHTVRRLVGELLLRVADQADRGWHARLCRRRWLVSDSDTITRSCRRGSRGGRIPRIVAGISFSPDTK